MYVGPSGLLGAPGQTRPAQPGEFISLYGTGFGSTNPPVPSDRIFSGAAPLTGTVKVAIGGVEATLQFAGMSAAGVCQFNVLVPDLPDGDHKLSASIGGIETQDNLFSPCTD